MDFTADRMAEFLVWGVAFVFSTTCHEAAHGFVAYKKGDPTAFQAGLVTLSPVPHVKRSPIGMVIVPLVCFFLAGYMIGWASVPVDRYWSQRHPHKSAWVSAAGPLANLALFIISALIIKILIWLSIQGVLSFGEGSSWVMVIHVLEVLFMLNLALLVFNLFPVKPLDGSEVILLFFGEERAPEIRAKMEAMGQFGFIIVFFAFGAIFLPIYRFMFNLFF